MDPLLDPRCLVTTEALFVDGANGVCVASRHGAGDAPDTISLLLFVAAIGIALFARAHLSPRRLALAGVVALGLAAVPGLWAIVAVRADRPVAVSTSALRVQRAHDEVQAFARLHDGARLRTETEISVVPIARLALTGLPRGGTAPIDLFDGTLEDGCRTRGHALVCGTPPAPFPTGATTP